MLRFRVTHWPNFPLPVPPVVRGNVTLWPEQDERWRRENPVGLVIDGESLDGMPLYGGGFLWGSRDERNPVVLPDGFYLRELMDFDPSSDKDMLRLVSEWGLISPWPDDPRLQGQLVPGTHGRGFRMVDAWPIQAAADLVETMRGATMLWHKQSAEHADHITSVVNYGLEGMPPRISLDPDSDPADVRTVGLYTACCIQFANDITAGVTYRRCANETCGRLFARQRGRAEFGQFKSSGVRYCSARCARAQAQRDLRRRRKAAKAENET